MEEESKYKIFTEPRGQYVMVQEKRIYQISFPSNATLEENLEALKEMEKAIVEAIEKKKEETKEEVVKE